MKNGVRLAALLVTALVTLVPVHSAEPLDLETAIAMALENNLGIQGEVAAVRQKKLVADTWWNRFYPSTSLRYTLGRSNQEQSFATTVPVTSTINPTTGGYDEFYYVTGDLPQWFMALGLDVSLSLTTQLFPGISLANLDYRAGLLSLEDARRQLARDIGKSFYDLLLMQAQIDLVAEQIDTAERRYNQALANYRNGLVDEYAMLSARVAWENQKPGLTGLETGYQRALMAFKLRVGLPFSADIEPVGEIDPPSLAVTAADVDRDALAQRLDLQQLTLLESILEEQERLQRASRLPLITFGLSVDPAFGGDPWRDNWFDTDLWSQQSGRFTITVVQPLDGWLPYSQTRVQISDVQTQIAQNRLNVEQALDGAEMEVRSLILSVLSAEETVAALELNIDLAQRAFELAEIGYNNGLRDLLEVQNAEVELKSAQFQVLQQKKTIMANLIDLEYALQMELTGDDQ